MGRRFAEIAFTPRVQVEQASAGSRAGYARVAEHGRDDTELTEVEAGFITGRDSFYMSTVSETGWPYLQHRGGPPGFVRVLDSRTLGWAEFAGNRQYVTAGNAAADERVALFFMDYPARRRLKLLGRLRLIDPADQPDLARQLIPFAGGVPVERLALVTLAAFDWNCPQHITTGEVAALTASLRTRIAELEDRLRKHDLLTTA